MVETLNRLAIEYHCASTILLITVLQNKVSVGHAVAKTIARLEQTSLGKIANHAEEIGR